MSVLALRDAILEGLSAELPEGTLVLASDGDLTIRGPQYRSIRGPAVVLGAIGFGDVSPSGASARCTSLWLAAVVTRHEDRAQGLMTRGDVAMVLAAQTMRTVAVAGRWGDAALSSPQNVRVQNLHSPELAERALAYWAVTWGQLVGVPDTLPAALPDFKLLRTEYDLAPVDGTIDATDTIPMEATP